MSKKSFLAYWTPETVDRSADGEPIRHAASEQYGRVERGDTVWFVTVRNGDLRLLGRIMVLLRTDKAGAARALKTQPRDLWDASHHIVATPGSVGPLREMPLKSVVAKLRFESASSPSLKHASGRVNPQQLQTMRTLTAESNALLEEVWGGRRSSEAVEGELSPETPVPAEGALASFLPDADARDALADSILVAHAKGPMSWCLSRREDYLRLNVGPIHVLFFSHQVTGLMADLKVGRSLGVAVKWRDAPQYRSVDGARWLTPPVADFAQFYSRVRAAHVATLAKAAQSRTRWPGTHSQVLVEELAALTRRSLPAPGYFDAGLSAPDEDEAVFAAHEGGVVFRQHLARERNAALVKAKKQDVLKRTQKLACEVCGFDFEKVYGEHGRGFVECHHAVALSTYVSAGRKTEVSELALVCSNCHRMLHRRRPWLAMKDLRRLLR